LALPAAEVAELVESEDLEAKEEEVFQSVINWVKEDEAGRKAELDRLLPLVRFPLMVDAPSAMMREALVSQHPLGMQLLYETTPGFAKSDITRLLRLRHPRLRPRGGGAAAQAARNPALLGLLELPAGAAPGAVRAALNKKNEYGDLPIHDALRDAATGPELVRAMLDAGGEAMLAVPGWNKSLPLHRAAVNSWSAAMVEILLARGPAGAARAKTATGRTPLAIAEQFNTGPAAAEIKALLRAAMR
jgi:hypothetical protein